MITNILLRNYIYITFRLVSIVKNNRLLINLFNNTTKQIGLIYSYILPEKNKERYCYLLK